jgi:hypothetical protein
MVLAPLETLTAHFRDVLASRFTATQLQPLDAGQLAHDGVFDTDRFLGTFTSIARRVGTAGVSIGDRETEGLAAAGVDWPMAEWTIDDIARTVLLLSAAPHLDSDPYATLVETCYRDGDNRERQAILRALPLLPDPPRFLTLGFEACRSHVQPVFEALACANPYPVRYFPELNWNQLVLKALFTGVSLERIWQLPERVSPELVRMATDYVSERRAAGRSLPDIRRLLSATGSQA